MKRILVATDTYKETIMFMEDIGKILYEKKIPFEFDKHRMIIKANDSMIVLVPETSGNMGLYQVRPFDYYMLFGDANWESTDWHKECISRTKIGAIQIDGWDELIKIIKGDGHEI